MGELNPAFALSTANLGPVVCETFSVVKGADQGVVVSEDNSSAHDMLDNMPGVDFHIGNE
ncbi:hypothetical protein U1Q18_022648, partial [Sarracenia purpurea var. burkii]